MSWKYRPDETDVLWGDGAPTASVTIPTLYIDRTSGAMYTNVGGVTWNGSGGSLRATRVLTAATTLTASDSGKDIFLNAAGGFSVTLPAPVAGMHFRFTAKTAPTGAAYIVAALTPDTMSGSVVTPATGAADTETDVTGDQWNFVANTAVVGDNITIWSDGTYWHGFGVSSAAGGITITG